MTSDTGTYSVDHLLHLCEANVILLIVALIGGLTLGILKLHNHYKLDDIQKHTPKYHYLCYVPFCIIGCPISGVFALLLYLYSENNVNALLAFQIGGTSPAILAGLLKVGADMVGQTPITTQDGQ